MNDRLKDEYAVVGCGVGHGLEQARADIWQGLKDAGHEFKLNPLKASGSYIKDHAGDLLASAAVGALVPKGMAGTMVGLWALQGIGAPVARASWSTWNESNGAFDKNAVRDSLSRELATQTHGLVSALPVTLAGGLLGGAAKNALMGPGKEWTGTTAPAHGERFAQISENWRNFSDNLLGAKAKAGLLDADGTLFAFPPYLANSFRRNVSMISTKMGMPEQEVLSILGPHKLNPWILQNSGLEKKYLEKFGAGADFEKEIAEPFWRNDAQAMQEKMVVFDGMRQTLDEARQFGMKLYVHTNAPEALAYQRLTATGLLRDFDKVFAVKTPEPSLQQVPTAESLLSGRQMVEQARQAHLSEGGPPVVGLDSALSKPSQAGLNYVLNEIGLRPAQVRAMGDNLRGDGTAPGQLGVPFMHARYGLAVDPADKAYLRQMRSANADAAEHLPEQPPKASAVAHEPADFISFLESRRPNLGQAWRIASDRRNRVNLLVPAISDEDLAERWRSWTK